MPHGSSNVKETLRVIEQWICSECNAIKKAGLKCTNPHCALNRS
jgi:hypothetical protein